MTMKTVTDCVLLLMLSTTATSWLSAQVTDILFPWDELKGE